MIVRIEVTLNEFCRRNPVLDFFYMEMIDSEPNSVFAFLEFNSTIEARKNLI